MPETSRRFLTISGLLLAAAVMLGAFGTHSLQNVLTPQQMTSFDSAVTYHFYHALGIVVVAFTVRYLPDSRLLPWAGWLMVVGIVFFSGSIYAITFGAPRSVAMAAPVGGISFMTAWVIYAWSAFSAKNS